jgi:hypothetical protein
MINLKKIIETEGEKCSKVMVWHIQILDELASYQLESSE